MIKLQNLSAYYEQNPQKKVLQDVSLFIEKGDIVSVLGPNGCGKSTLLSLIAGITVPGLITMKSSSIILDGKNADSYKRKNLSQKVSLLAQHEQYSWPFSVFDAVLMGRYAHSSWIEPYSKEDIDSAEYQLEELNITHLRNRSIFELSGGEYQRVMIARALAQSTEILLLDEPFTHLDINSQHSLLTLIKKIAQQKNSTVLMSLHDINAAPLFSNKTILLREGNLVCCGNTSLIFSGDYLSKAYDTEFGFFKHPYYNVMQSYITSAV